MYNLSSKISYNARKISLKHTVNSEFNMMKIVFDEQKQ